MQQDRPARRSVMSAAGAALAAFALGSKTVRAQSTGGGFRVARHPQDAWLDAVPGRHRTFIDAATVNGAGEGMLYANNLYVANKAGYGLDPADIAVVICLRHFATVFAFNDAIWAKYGKAMSDVVQFTDPRTRQAPSSNLLNAADLGPSLPNLGTTIDSVVKRGTRFAVCQMATQFISGQVAAAVKASPDAVLKEFSANLIPNSHSVAAGVVATNRAQEYGYTLLTAL